MPSPLLPQAGAHKEYFDALRCAVERARLLLGKGGTLKHERDKPYTVLGKREVVRDERPKPSRPLASSLGVCSSESTDFSPVIILSYGRGAVPLEREPGVGRAGS